MGGRRSFTNSQAHAYQTVSTTIVKVEVGHAVSDFDWRRPNIYLSAVANGEPCPICVIPTKTPATAARINTTWSSRNSRPASWISATLAFVIDRGQGKPRSSGIARNCQFRHRSDRSRLSFPSQESGGAVRHSRSNSTEAQITATRLPIVITQKAGHPPRMTACQLGSWTSPVRSQHAFANRFGTPTSSSTKAVRSRLDFSNRRIRFTTSDFVTAPCE